MKYLLVLLIGIMFMAEGCRPPRCRIPTCYVRLKHRHGGENLKAAATRSDFNSDNNGQNPETNLGKEYRGVPWWKKNKNPKIAEGYKPGYKYDYRKPKYRKPRQKKSKNPEEETPVAGEEQLTEEGEVQPQNGQPAEEAAPEQAEGTPKRKGLFRRRNEKKQKQPIEEKPVPEEQKPQEENDGF